MKKELEFEIKNGRIMVGDDNIRLNTIKMIAVRPSFMKQGQYALQVCTTSMVLELYFTGTEQEIQKEFLKLCSAIKKENPQFYGIFYEYLVNFDNIEEVVYQNKYINPCAKVHFVDGGDLIFKASEDDFDKLNNDFEEYNTQKEDNTTI